MQTTFRARVIATGMKSHLAMTRLIWSGSLNGGSEAAWAALTHGLESLTASQVQQRFAALVVETATVAQGGAA